MGLSSEIFSILFLTYFVVLFCYGTEDGETNKRNFNQLFEAISKNQSDENGVYYQNILEKEQMGQREVLTKIEEDLKPYTSCENQVIKLKLWLSEARRYLENEKSRPNITQDSRDLDLGQVQPETPQFARTLQCPTKIRHTIELFQKQNGTDDNSTMQRRTYIHTRIRNILGEIENKEITLQNLVKYFVSLAKNSDTTKEQINFQDALARLKEVNVLVPTGWKIERSEKVSNLSSALLQLDKANEDDVEKIWKNQKESFWKHREPTTLNSTDHEIVRNLSQLSNRKFIEACSKIKFQNQREQTYTYDIVKTGKVLKPGTPDRYQMCIWVMYNSVHRDMIKIWENMVRKWPNLERWEMSDLYCTEFEILYNLVSELSEHSGGEITPASSQCEFDENNYKRYIEVVTATMGEKMTFVVESLYTRDLDGKYVLMASIPTSHST